jgi:hypothetical protein
MGKCDNREDIMKVIGNYIMEWGEKNVVEDYRNYSGFLENTENKNKLDSFLEKYKRNTGNSVEYRFFPYKVAKYSWSYILKLRINNENKFYCQEGTGKIVENQNENNNFDKKLFCSNKNCEIAGMNNQFKIVEICLD